jgi:protein subunit release factor A
VDTYGLEPGDLEVDTFRSSEGPLAEVRVVHLPTGLTGKGAHEETVQARDLALRDLADKLRRGND